MMMNRYLKIIFLLLILTGCKAQQKSSHDPVKDLPKEITERFAIPRVQTKETAIAICKLIIKENNTKVNVEELVVDKAILIADDKVWEIVLKSPVSGFMHQYHIRINKNTCEILNFWVSK